MKRIGLFGGSFDPIHMGHIEVAKQVRKKLSLHEVWFLPTIDTPLKQNLVASFLQRCKMVKLAIKPFSYLKLHTEENEMPQPSYTINLITYLKKKYPDYQFYWIIGDDQYSQLDRWYRIEELKELVQFVVVNRHLTTIANKEYVWLKISAHPASSSAVRKGEFQYLYPTVIQYINKNALYYPEIIKQFLSDYRYQHTICMTELAMDLAQRHAMDFKRARIAGLLHDIAKDIPTNQAKEIMENYFPEYVNQDEAIWHQYLGAFLAKRKFKLRDKQAIKAIYHHTLGTSSGLLSKIIYCADKTDDTRKYDKSLLREKCKENINEGFLLVKERAEQHHRERKESEK